MSVGSLNSWTNSVFFSYGNDTIAIEAHGSTAYSRMVIVNNTLEFQNALGDRYQFKGSKVTN